MYSLHVNTENNELIVTKVVKNLEIIAKAKRGLRGPQGIPGSVADAPVTSVNAQLGDVVLDANDVGADPSGSAADALADANAYTDQEIATIDLSDYETTTQLNARDLANRSRANHTGTQLASTISDFDAEVSNNTDVAANTSARHTHSNKALLDTYSQTEANLADAVAKKHTHANQAILDATTASFLIADETKLDGIAAGATVNSTDAFLLARANHTGSQAISTVTGLQTALDDKVAKAGDTMSGTLVNSASASLNIATGGGTTKDAIQIGSGGAFIGQDFGNITVRSGFSPKEFRFQDDSGVTQATVSLNTGAASFNGDITVPDEIYGSGWNGSLEVPTKNAVYDKLEAIILADGDVNGPASSTDNAIARFDGTTGKLVQNSSASVDDSGNGTFASAKIGGGSTGFFQDSSNVALRAGSSNALYFQSNNGNNTNMFINSSGNVAIGLNQTSPTSKLDITVANAGNVPGLTVTQNDTTNNPKAVVITNTTSGTSLEVTNSGSTQKGVVINQGTTTNREALGVFVTSAYAGGTNTSAVRLEMTNTSASGTLQYNLQSGTGNALMLDHDNNGVALFVDKDVTNANHTANTVTIDHTSVVNDGTTKTKTGAALQINSNVTETSGTITDSAQVLDINQTHADASGDVVNISSNGVGSIFRVAWSGLHANSSSKNLILEDTAVQTQAGVYAYYRTTQATSVGQLAYYEQNASGNAVTIDNNNNGRSLNIDHDGNSASAITGLWVNSANAGAGAAYAAIFEAGRVGIGNTAPAEALHVTGNVRVPKGNSYQLADSNIEMRLDDSPAWLSRTNVMTFKTYGDTPTSGGAWVWRNSMSSTNNMVLFPENTTQTYPMLGLGTSAPTHSFTIASSGTGIALYNTSDQTTNYERFLISNVSNVVTLATSKGGTGTARVLKLTSGGTSTVLEQTGDQHGTSRLTILNRDNFNGVLLEVPSLNLADLIFQPQTAASRNLRFEGRNGYLGSTTNLSELQLGVAGQGAGGSYFNVGDKALSVRPEINTASSGTSAIFSILPRYNQTSTAAATDLLINRTQTAVGSGAQLLIDAQVAGTSRFRVTNNGGTVIDTASGTAVTGLSISSNNTASVSLEITQTGGNANAAYIHSGGNVHVGNMLRLRHQNATDSGDTLLIEQLGTGDALVVSDGTNENINITKAGRVFIANQTAPGSNPTAGGYMYVESGALKYRGSSGTITTIANA